MATFTFHNAFILAVPSIRKPFAPRISKISRVCVHSLMGRIYQQSYVDTYSKLAEAKLYTTKTPITAADLLNDRVLPLLQKNGMGLIRILTDRGTEYCGKVETLDYELYLGVNGIEHTKTLLSG